MRPLSNMSKGRASSKDIETVHNSNMRESLKQGEIIKLKETKAKIVEALKHFV